MDSTCCSASRIAFDKSGPVPPKPIGFAPLCRQVRNPTLATDLGITGATTDDVYKAMDWLAARQDAIEQRLAKRHLTPGGMVLVDLSGSYVEGRHNELAARGFSRDGKRGKAQITYGLITDRDGRPVAVEVFPGNTSDPAALIVTVDKIRERFGLSEVESSPAPR